MLVQNESRIKDITRTSFRGGENVDGSLHRRKLRLKLRSLICNLICVIGQVGQAL